MVSFYTWRALSAPCAGVVPGKRQMADNGPSRGQEEGIENRV